MRISSFKAVFGRKFVLVPSKTGLKIAVLGKRWSTKIKVWFCHPGKGTFFRGTTKATRGFKVILGTQIGWVNSSVCEIAHVRKRNPLSNLDKTLKDGIEIPQASSPKFRWQSVKGFEGGWGKFCLSRLNFVVLFTTLAQYRARVWMYLSIYWCMSAFVAGSFVNTTLSDWLGRKSLKLPIYELSWTLTQSLIHHTTTNNNFTCSVRRYNIFIFIHHLCIDERNIMLNFRL